MIALEMSDSSDARFSRSVGLDESEHDLCIIFKGFRQRQKSCPFRINLNDNWPPDRASPVSGRGHHWLEKSPEDVGLMPSSIKIVHERKKPGWVIHDLWRHNTTTIRD